MEDTSKKSATQPAVLQFRLSSVLVLLTVVSIILAVTSVLIRDLSDDKKLIVWGALCSCIIGAFLGIIVSALRRARALRRIGRDLLILQISNLSATRKGCLLALSGIPALGILFPGTYLIFFPLDEIPGVFFIMLYVATAVYGFTVFPDIIGPAMRIWNCLEISERGIILQQLEPIYWEKIYIRKWDSKNGALTILVRRSSPLKCEVPPEHRDELDAILAECNSKDKELTEIDKYIPLNRRSARDV
jgi:hypothetical protein